MKGSQTYNTKLTSKIIGKYIYTYTFKLKLMSQVLKQQI